MYCKNCNCKYEKGKFCYKCGSPLLPDPVEGEPTERKETEEKEPIERKETGEKEKSDINTDETKIVLTKAIYQNEVKSDTEEKKAETLPKEERKEEQKEGQREKQRESQGEKQRESQGEKQKESQGEKQKEGKHLQKKKWLVAAVLLFVLVSVAAVSIKIIAGKKGKFSLYGKNAISVQYLGNDGQLVLLLADGTKKELEEKNYVIADISLDGTVIGLISDDGILYLLDKTGYEQVDENVRWVVVSDTGAALAYLTMDTNEEYGELYQYDIAKKQSVQIASDACIGNIAISPDGKSIAFLDDKERCHLYINGKENEDTIRAAIPLAIADGGKYFYYAKNDNIYAMKKKSDAVKIGSLENDLYFNKNYSQFLYAYDGKTYYCNKASKADEAVFSTGEATPYIPFMAQRRARKVYDSEGSFLENVYVIGTEKLSGLAYDVDGGLYCLTKKMEAERIASSYDNAQISEDGKSLLYLKDEKLYRVSGLNKSPEEERVGEKGVMAFAANENLSKIYYRNDEGELMYIKGDKDAKVIYDEPFYDYFFAVGDYLYFLGDYSESTRCGTLYASKNGGKMKQISSSDEIGGLLRIYGTMYFQEEDEMFSVTGTKKKALE